MHLLVPHPSVTTAPSSEEQKRLALLLSRFQNVVAAERFKNRKRKSNSNVFRNGLVMELIVVV